MKSVAVGTTSGCVIWVMAFGMVLLCLCPVAAAIGGVAFLVAAPLGTFIARRSGRSRTANT